MCGQPIFFFFFHFGVLTLEALGTKVKVLIIVHISVPASLDG